MEFGSVPISQIKKINFKLPKDPGFTLATLKQAKQVKDPLIYVGCSKWGRKEWVGKIYPEKTKEADFLKEYVKHFNSLELNATHYKMPTAAVIQHWQSFTAGQDFKFCPKIWIWCLVRPVTAGVIWTQRWRKLIRAIHARFRSTGVCWNSATRF